MGMAALESSTGDEHSADKAAVTLIASPRHCALKEVSTHVGLLHTFLVDNRVW